MSKTDGFARPERLSKKFVYVYPLCREGARSVPTKCGFYGRKVIILFAIVETSVARYRCRRKGRVARGAYRTFSLLPQEIHPHSRYGPAASYEVLKESSRRSLTAALAEFAAALQEISVNTIYRIKMIKCCCLPGKNDGADGGVALSMTNVRRVPKRIWTPATKVKVWARWKCIPRSKTSMLSRNLFWRCQLLYAFGWLKAKVRPKLQLVGKLIRNQGYHLTWGTG